MILLQLSVIFACLALGELVVWLTGIPVPSSIIGMLLLTTALQCRIIPLRHVEGVADFLVKNLGFFFVPAGVGLMTSIGVISHYWAVILISCPHCRRRHRQHHRGAGRHRMGSPDVTQNHHPPWTI